MPNASLGKVMFCSIMYEYYHVSVFKIVWTVLFNKNGKFCKYTGNVVCTISIRVISSYL